MTHGPTPACFNFHCDGDYATGTLQVALNNSEDHQGGRQCFLDNQNDTLVVLERPAGSILQHPRSILHAVTSLTAGTRKSLFVVDETNWLGEGGAEVVSASDVKLFSPAQSKPRNSV